MSSTPDRDRRRKHIHSSATVGRSIQSAGIVRVVRVTKRKETDPRTCLNTAAAPNAAAGFNARLAANIVRVEVRLNGDDDA